SEPLLAGLRARPRAVTGRCGACRHLGICNGSSRVRPFRAYGDVWAEDPGCYLTDAEIGLDPAEEGADALALA
ncbi:MAG: heme d1 biosynthesis radical SAM protein NirJ, partial [Acetobacteraceae bacterium]|nr:heme d1 biosynthesis radical SAM protein NirJ [Acetobacteraceae bacterium]